MEDYGKERWTLTHYQTGPWLCNTTIGLLDLSSRAFPIQQIRVSRCLHWYSGKYFATQNAIFFKVYSIVYVSLVSVLIDLKRKHRVLWFILLWFILILSLPPERLRSFSFSFLLTWVTFTWFTDIYSFSYFHLAKGTRSRILAPQCFLLHWGASGSPVTFSSSLLQVIHSSIILFSRF